MTNESDYMLTAEIPIDEPCGAILKKGQICRARYSPDHENDFLVFDEINPGHWKINGYQAKVI